MDQQNRCGSFAKVLWASERSGAAAGACQQLDRQQVATSFSISLLTRPPEVASGNGFHS